VARGLSRALRRSPRPRRLLRRIRYLRLGLLRLDLLALALVIEPLPCEVLLVHQLHLSRTERLARPLEKGGATST
jgi:hypothetical protein